MNLKRRILALALTGLMNTTAVADLVHFRSSEEQAQLLELYTSEGCSSCPPADKWIAKLKTEKRLWSEVIPVVFHVDYWDRLGWRDRFANPTFTHRQRTHAQAWGSGRVYTPGFVLNGKEWRGFFTRRSLPKRPESATGVLMATRGKKDAWRIVFKPTSTAKRENRWTIHAAILGSGLKTEVKAGENRGRTLHHEFTVLMFLQGDMARKGAEFSSTLVLSPPEKDASSRLAAAFWVCPSNTQIPAQAVGGWLPAR